MVVIQRTCLNCTVFLPLVLLALSLLGGRALAGEGKPPELLLPLGHSSSVISVALSGDGKRVLTGSEDNSAILWDVKVARPLRFFKGHTQAVVSVGLSENGQRALTASRDRTAILWDTSTAKPLQIFKKQPGEGFFAALSADGTRVLTASAARAESKPGVPALTQHTAILWEAATGQPLQTFKWRTNPGAFSPVALSGDGKCILTISRAEGLGALWNSAAERFGKFLPEMSPVEGMATLWNAETGKALRTFRLDTREMFAVLSRDGQRALTGGTYNQTATLWDTATGKILRTFRISPDRNMSMTRATLSAIGLSGDGKRAFTAVAALGGLTNEIENLRRSDNAILWNAETGKPLHSLKSQGDFVSAAVVGSDGQRVLTGSWDRTAILWDGDTGKVHRTFKGHAASVFALAQSRDGKQILTGSGDSTAVLWNLDTARPLQTLKRHTQAVISVGLSRDGKRLLTGSRDQTAILWDAGTGKPLRTFANFQGGLNEFEGAALSGDGKRVLIAGSRSFVFARNHRAELHDADSGNLLRTFETAKILSLLLSGDGKRALTGFWWNDRSAVLWDVGNGKPLQTFKGHTSDGITSVILSEDGKRVLTGSFDSTAILWDAGTGRAIQTFKGHTSVVSAVGLSADGKHVLTGCWDGTAILWDAETARPIQTCKGHTGWIHSVTVGANLRYVVTASEDGTVRIWKPGRDEPIFSLLSAGDEWLFWTPEGYYTCSPNGENLIAWKVHDDSPQGYRIVGPEQFRKQFHRPDLFRHLLKELDLKQALAAADRESGRNPTPVTTIAAALPPYVIIAQPLKAREIIKTEECQIVAKARSVGDNHVASLQLLIDGRPYEGGRAKFTIPQPRPGEATASWQATLAPGKRRIQVLAEGVQGSTSLSEEIEIIRAEEVETLPKLLLLSVGISAYAKTERRGVEYAGADAKRFLEAQLQHSKRLYTDVDSISLTSGDAGKADILDAFDVLSKKARAVKNSITLIFLAGHGKVSELGDFYFLAADSDPQKLRATAISGAELKDALKNIPGRVIVFLDACHSGAFAGDAFRSIGLTDDLFRELTSPDCGVVLLCSSRGRELSQQSNSQKAGLFTLAVVEGLSGKATKDKNGAIYLPDLFAYVNRRVRELSEDQQHPYSSELSRIGNVPLTRP